MKEVKNHGHSIRVKLLEISREIGRPYQTLLIRYIHERLLYRLSVSEYRDKFCLKGGALLYAFERFEARPTIDIDFLGRHIAMDLEQIKSVFSKFIAIKCEEDGVLFDLTSITAEEVFRDNLYDGIRVGVLARIDTVCQKISMDIGFGDKVVPSALSLEYPLLIDGVPAAEIMAYSLETVVAEKFQAMVALGEANSRMKDFFDVYRILTTHTIDEETLSEAIRTTFKTRGTLCESDNPLFNPAFAEEPSRVAAWNNFLRKIKWPGPITFKDVWQIIINRLVYIPLTTT